MTRARDNADLGDSYGVLGAGVTGGSGLTALGTVTSGTYNGVLGDSYTTSALYYCQANCDGENFTLSDNAMINTSGDTPPYFTYTGDTTNIIGFSDHDIKLVKAGIYLITFSATFTHLSTTESRYVGAAIRGSGTNSEDTTTIAIGYDQIANVHSSFNDYANVTVSAVKSFGANNLINFYICAGSDINPQLFGRTHASICLIRPT